MTHPSHEILAAFGSGRLADAESSSVQLHLETCLECRTVVEKADDDSLVELLRTGPPVSASAGWDAARFTEVQAALDDHPRYELMELLGAGGMGAVFKARHKLMDRLVALKVLRPDFMAQQDAVERFRREVKTAAKLAHANIVTAHDADQAGNVHFLVMEYVPGATLAELLRTRGRLSIHEACAYVRQAALGLEYAAQHGMVHRDLKPGNLILAPNGQIKILDFGLARFFTESETSVVEAAPVETKQLSQAGMILGTADYLAPEQFRDASQADARSDLYSLGCTLFHLLTGKPPFAGAAAAAKAEAHARREPPSVRASRPDVPIRLASLVARLLAKDPSDRIQTAAELAKELAPFALSQLGPRPRRRWSFAAAALLGLCLLWVGVAVGPSVYRFVTDQGVIVIETDDPDVEVIVKQRGQQITLLDGKTQRQVTLSSGAYHLELAPGKDGLRLEAEAFTLTRAGKAIVRVWRENKLPLPADGNRHAAEWVLRQGGRIEYFGGDGALRAASRIDELPAGAVRLHVAILAGCANVTDDSLANLHGSALEGIELHDTAVTDAGLVHLQQLRHLRTIRLGQHIKGPGLVHLKPLRLVETVNLSGAKDLADEALKHLSELPRLSELCLDHTHIGDAGIKHIASMTSLQKLLLNSTAVSDDGLVHLAGLTRLQTLDLGKTLVTGTGLRQLAGLERLIDLQLGESPITNETLADIKHLRQLRRLVLRDTAIGNRGLAHLRELSQLQALEVANTSIGDAGLEELLHMKSLQMLDLGETKITAAGLRSLQAMTSLQGLIMLNVRLGDEDLRHLTALTKLRTLDLHKSGINGTGLRYLKDLRLEWLSLANNPLKPGSLDVFKQMPTLRWLDLTGAGVSEATIESLRKHLPNCEITYDK